ncbi:hypothetical protein KKB44_04540, partial [Candidatus Micrarchaeota archaeon]|nr:hypothetical protein [Candidatus Micrarchaeota archaeon]
MELRHDTQKNRKEDKKGEEKDTSKLKAILASSLLVGTIATVNSCVFDGQWGLRDEEDATYVDAGEETGVEFDADRDAGVDAETVEPDARVDGGDTDTRVDADEVDLDGGDAEVHEDADTSEDADARVDGGDTELDADEVDLDGGDA